MKALEQYFPLVPLIVPRVINTNFLLTLTIHTQEKRL